MITSAAVYDHDPSLATKIYPTVAAPAAPPDHQPVCTTSAARSAAASCSSCSPCPATPASARSASTSAPPTWPARPTPSASTRPPDRPALRGPVVLPAGVALRPGPARTGLLRHRPAGRAGHPAGDGPGGRRHRRRRGDHDPARARPRHQLPEPGVSTYQPKPWLQATSPATAPRSPSSCSRWSTPPTAPAPRPGSRASQVAAKTGTAQTGTGTHRRLVRRLRPGRQPDDRRGGAPSQPALGQRIPGGTIAAPIAKAIIEADLAGPAPVTLVPPPSRLGSDRMSHSSRSSATATRWSATSPEAGWPRCTWPGTSCSTARSR